MIPFSPPHIDQQIIDAVTETLRSGWITTGPKTKQFEKNLTAYAGHRSTLCLNSATAGLEIILRWFGVKEGDEVILPAYTYCATANVIEHCGATPVFVDINDDFNISVSEIRKAITPRTKVIMPVDFGGYPCDYNEINALVKSDTIRSLFVPASGMQQQLGRILVLSDAAHSLGALYHRQKTGSLTDITVFSFHAVKNLTTAEGGAIALNLPEPFNNESIYQDLCIRTLHGQNKDALAKSKPGNWRYDVMEPGYKMNMTDIMASMGLVELERYESLILPDRKRIFEAYTNAFRQYPWAVIPEYTSTDKTSSYHLYALGILNVTEQERDEIISHIFQKQVSVNVHFIPVPMLGYYKKKGYDITRYPKTYAKFSNEISLPVFVGMTDEQIQTVISAVAESVDAVLKNKPHIHQS